MFTHCGDIKNANKTKLKTFQWICSVLDMCWISGNVCIVRKIGNISGQSLCHLRALGYWVTAQVTEKQHFFWFSLPRLPFLDFWLSVDTTAVSQLSRLALVLGTDPATGTASESCFSRAGSISMNRKSAEGTVFSSSGNLSRKNISCSK